MTSSKFGGLSADVAKPFRMEILHPVTGLPMTTKDGQAAYIDLLSADSDEGRAFDKEQRTVLQRGAMQRGAANVDALEIQIDKTARLTKGWLLVDLDGNVIDVPCTVENAKELYANPGTSYIYRQAFVATNELGNFISSASKPSANSPRENSGTPAA